MVPYGPRHKAYTQIQTGEPCYKLIIECMLIRYSSKIAAKNGIDFCPMRRKNMLSTFNALGSTIRLRFSPTAF